MNLFPFHRVFASRLRSFLFYLCGTVLFVAIVSGCNNQSQKPGPVPNGKTTADTTPRVTGIGGIFFKSQNPKEVKEWYSRHLGLATNEYGSVFEFRNTHKPEEINYLQWSAFNEKTKYFAPSEKQFMINYRVQHIEKLVENLRKDGVTILDTIEVVEYGKFVHIMDPEGNKLELWEPVDSILTRIGAETTK